MAIQTIDMGTFSFENSVDANAISPYVNTNVPEKPSKASKAEEKTIIKEIVKEVPNEDEVKEHQEHVIMLSRYGQSKRFADYLKSMGFVLSVDKLQKKPLQELKELLNRVRVSLDNKNTSNFWNNMVFGGIGTVEALAVNSRLNEKIKLRGVTEVLQQDHTFLDLIEQLELESQIMSYTSPQMRLTYTVINACVKCHAINTMLERQNSKPLGEPVEVEEEVPLPIPEKKKSVPPKKSDVIEFD